MSSKKKIIARNTHFIGFNDAEYALIRQKANSAGLYPRQLLMRLLKGDSSV